MHNTIKRLAVIPLLACSIAVQAASGRSDYDINDNGLIEINDLDDLYASQNSADGSSLYGSSEGCPETGCNGFELTTDLDFDTNGDGRISKADDYWRSGVGWYSTVVFSGIFDGNGHLIRNLYSTRGSGLFGSLNGATVRNLGLDGPAMSISGSTYSGTIASKMSNATLSKVFSTGTLSGSQRSGGLIGEDYGTSYISDSFVTGNITATQTRVGGFVGQAKSITITNSYTTAYVSGPAFVGAFLGESNGTQVITNTHWATDATGQSTSYRSNASVGYLGATVAELQCPTSASDTSCVSGSTLYDGWSSDTWDFGTSSQMPGLKMNGVVYRDSDGDGAVDSHDAFMFNAAASVDTDGDGLPTVFNPDCDSECQTSSGLTLDDDSDNDGVINEEDDFPLNAAASTDTDGDGMPDSFNSTCDADCQQDSGLTLDDDIDGDGVANDDDPDNSADNGAPEIQCAPDPVSIGANSEDGTLLLVSAENLEYYQSEFCIYDAFDSYEDLSLQGSIDGAVLTLNDDNDYELPTGAVEIEWIATDTAGNQSEPVTTIINVYPQLRFARAESVTGEPSTAQITVSLTGVSPQYPVNIEYAVDSESSSVTQDDIDNSFDITATHTVMIEEGENGENTEAAVSIPVLKDAVTEADETLVLSISGAVFDEGEDNYFAVNANKIHTLTITEANIAPDVHVEISQNGVTVASVNPDDGDVTLTAIITDGNGDDTHTLVWNISSLNVTSSGNGNEITFSPQTLADGEYNVSVTVTDSGNAPLSTTAELTLVVAGTVAEPSPGNSSSGGHSGGGAFFYLLLLTPLLLMSQRKAVSGTGR